jgi:hypothetical protein
VTTDRFEQQEMTTRRPGRPFTYAHKLMIVFFTIMMHFRRIFRFRAQRRWLQNHRQQATELGFESLPVRTTLSWRYKKLYPVVQAFIAFVGAWAEALDGAFAGDVWPSGG